MELVNATHFAAERVVLQDRAGIDALVAIVKATYAVTARGVEVAEEQRAVRLADSFHGEPGASSAIEESDLVPHKPGTDVVAFGHAVAPRERVRELDVEIAVGPVRRALRVFGDRRWIQGAGGVTRTPPVPFDRMPIVYERAFGGGDVSSPERADHEGEPRNPVGVGLIARRSRARIEDVPLPNIEDPTALLEEPRGRPAPAGLGFIGRGWMPRAALAGTYDAAWRHRRAPALPEDFDERFWNGASPGLVVPRHLRGDEEVTLVHLGPGGPRRFTLPGARPRVRVAIGGAEEALDVALDTVLIDLDELRVSLVWRGRRSLRGSDLLHVRRVRVEEGRL